MLTIREIKERTEAFFQAKGVQQARLDTDTLIAHTLGLKRLELYLDLDRPLTEAQLNKLRPLVKRRGQREPLQYIIGDVDFCSITLKVDRRALIPRPETEELIELVAGQMSQAPATILDMGTGTGAIALALAKRYPEARIQATDANPEALELAMENATALGLDARVHFSQGSWFEAVEPSRRFDLIVANPPYLTASEMSTTEPEVGHYEPKSALVSGPDGLDDLREIVGKAAQFLTEQGRLALETGIAHHSELEALARSKGLKGTSHPDLSGRPRFFFTLPVRL